MSEWERYLLVQLDRMEEPEPAEYDEYEEEYDRAEREGLA